VQDGIQFCFAESDFSTLRHKFKINFESKISNFEKI